MTGVRDRAAIHERPGARQVGGRDDLVFGVVVCTIAASQGWPIWYGMRLRLRSSGSL